MNRCTGKCRFDTHREAQNAAQTTAKAHRSELSARRVKEKRRVRVQAYRCSDCGGYHVGHAK